MMITLRDMIESDIEDNVRWFTKEIEWTYWDSPDEAFEPMSEADERASWTDYWDSVREMPADCKRFKFEIDADGRHVGWISSYNELAFFPMEEGGVGLGLMIPEISDRGRGWGTQALRQYMDYLRAHGHTCFYLETWSGNLPMLAAVQKLGFTEVCRREGTRIVQGQPYDALVLMLKN